MIELIAPDTLRVAFPEVHEKAECTITFRRTVRVPDDGDDYPLPAGISSFPMFCVDDYDVPAAWTKHGGVFLPMHPSEAMWIDFVSRHDYPFAIKVAAGKINAVTGTAWTNTLSNTPEQDYMVLPDQRWLDGFAVAKGVIRQFVAVPLGDGVTAEEQITGRADVGGLQLLCLPMKASEYEERIEAPMRLAIQIDDLTSNLRTTFLNFESTLEQAAADMTRLREKLQLASGLRINRRTDPLSNVIDEAETALAHAQRVYDEWHHWLDRHSRRARARFERDYEDPFCAIPASLQETGMGFGLGGKIKQEIAKDPWGIDAWDITHISRCFVHIMPSASFEATMGIMGPAAPISPQDYAKLKLPWFDYQVEGGSLEGSQILQDLKSVSATYRAKGIWDANQSPIPIARTIDLTHRPHR